MYVTGRVRPEQRGYERLELVRSLFRDTHMKIHGWSSQLLDEYIRSQGWIDVLQACADDWYPCTKLFT